MIFNQFFSWKPQQKLYPYITPTDRSWPWRKLLHNLSQVMICFHSTCDAQNCTNHLYSTTLGSRILVNFGVDVHHAGLRYWFVLTVKPEINHCLFYPSNDHGEPLLIFQTVTTWDRLDCILENLSADEPTQLASAMKTTTCSSLF